MTSMTQHERAELDELRQRVEALEARVAQIGTEEDGVYPVLAAREFQLGDSEDHARALLRIDDEGMVMLQLWGTRDGSNAVVLAADGYGPSIMLTDAAQRTRLLIQLDEDGTPRVHLLAADETQRFELVGFEIGTALRLMDSQERERVLLVTGGDQEDRALLSVRDGEGTEGFSVNMAAIGEDGDVALDGWPQWFGDSLKRAWQRINEIEKRLGGDAT